MRCKNTLFQYADQIQLNPALTDFRWPTISFCYRWTSVLAKKENKRNPFKETIDLHLLVLGPLERGSTVHYQWINGVGWWIDVFALYSLQLLIKASDRRRNRGKDITVNVLPVLSITQNDNECAYSWFPFMCVRLTHNQLVTYEMTNVMKAYTHKGISGP